MDFFSKMKGSDSNGGSTGSDEESNQETNKTINQKKHPTEEYIKTEKEGFFKKVGKTAGFTRKTFDSSTATVVRPKIVIRGDIIGMRI